MYIDAHAHLDKYDSDLQNVIQEIERHRVFTVSVSMDPEGYTKSRRIDDQSNWVLSTFGIHPWNAPKFHPHLEQLEPLIESSPMIGEIGLDYRFIHEPENHVLQRDVFRYLATRGVRQRKILNVHCTGAEADVDRILGEVAADRVIVHWYSGPMAQLKNLVERRAFFTVGVQVLFSSAIQEIAKAIPPDLLLTETDNPGGYEWLTKTRGMPSIVESVVHALSELRNWSAEKTQNIVRENFFRLVEQDPWAHRLSEAHEQ